MLRKGKKKRKGSQEDSQQDSYTVLQFLEASYVEWELLLQ